MPLAAKAPAHSLECEIHAELRLTEPVAGRRIKAGPELRKAWIVVRKMSIFLATAETQGLASAARKLSLSAASVTRSVVALEQRIGARLLNRSSRSVRLTEADNDLCWTVVARSQLSTKPRSAPVTTKRAAIDAAERGWGITLAVSSNCTAAGRR